MLLKSLFIKVRRRTDRGRF